MRQLRIRVLGLWLTVIYIAASATAGFAHTLSGQRAAEPAVDLSAYALPDGTVPVICINGPADADAPQAGGQRLCDACLLTSAPGFCASPAEITPVDFAAIPISAPLSTHETWASAEFRPHAPRGPPAG